MLTFKSKILLIGMIFFLSTASIIGQELSDSEIEQYRFGASEEPENCEINSLNIMLGWNLLSRDKNQNNVLILIARLGKGENKRDLNRRRLFNVNKRLNVSEKRVVLAEGERVDGFGRIEFYWKGKKIGTLFARKNQDICVDCCGPDERYYPDKDDVDRRQKTRKNRRN